MLSELMNFPFVSSALRKAAPLALVFCVGCGSTTSGSAVVENVDRLIEVTNEVNFQVAVSEGDAQWENRHERAATEAAIAAWELAIHAETPGQDRRAVMQPIFVKLSQAYYWMAHAHERYEPGSSPETMQAFYATGMEYGAQAIAMNNDEWRRALLYETPVSEAVVHLTPADVPAVYWHATNLGRWGLERGIATVLSRVNDIKSMMDRVEAMNPDYYYNAVNRYLGVYYTKLPFGNPDVQQAQRRFQEAIEAFPGYLETRVLYGYDYVVVTQERDVAVEQLEAVLAADIDALPQEIRAENINAQRRAQELLDDIDEWVR